MTEERFRQILENYRKLVLELEDLDKEGVFSETYGIHIDDSPELLGLCLRCAGCQTPEEAAGIIGGSLAYAWVLNVDWQKTIGEFSWGLPEFPNGYSNEEVERWQYVESTDKKLSELLAQRIGICLSYSFTLGIVLKVLELAEKVSLGSYYFSGVGHMVVLTEGPECKFDLAHRASTGRNEFPEGLTITGTFGL